MLRLTTICLAVFASCALAPSAGAAVIASPDTTLHTKPPTLGNDSTPAFSFSSDRDFATFDCRYAASASESWSSTDDFGCGSSENQGDQATYEASPLSDGTRYFQVRSCAVIDTGEEMVERCDSSPARATFTIDTVAPPLSAYVGSIDHRVNTSQAITFSSTEAGAVFRCQLDQQQAFGCADSFQSGTQLAQGGHTMKVQAGDAAGNWSAPATKTFVWDTVAPVPTLFGPGLTKDSTPDFAISSNAGSYGVDWHIHACAFGLKNVSLPTVSCNGPTFTPDAPLADGTYELHVALSDGLNVSAYKKIEATVDTTPPEIRSITWDAETMEIFIDTDPVALECSFDGQDPYACGPTQSGDRGLAPGKHTFAATAIDDAGNRSTKTIEFTIPGGDPDPEDPQDPQDPQDPGTGGQGGAKGGSTPVAPAGPATPVAPATNGPAPATAPPSVDGTTPAAKKAKKAKRCSTKKLKKAKGRKAAKKRAAKRRCGKPRKRSKKRVARRA